MRLGIVMPVILQEQALLDFTREAVASLRTSHDASLYVVCNRLHLCTAEELQSDLQARTQLSVHILHEPGVSRSVSQSWTRGAQLALENSPDYLAFVANDTRLNPDCLDLLVDFGQQHTTDLWSGICHNQNSAIDPFAVTDGADFTCFMLRPATLKRHGWFDPNFKPAYFEDNDYYARIILAGGTCQIVHAAQLYHHGSATIKRDPEAAHHVNHWFEINRSYFARKWGVSEPGGNRDDILCRYYRHPFNDLSRPLSWFPAED